MLFTRPLMRNYHPRSLPTIKRAYARLEINDMTGWWAIYIDGEYQGQRESKSEAESVMKQLCKK